MMVQRAGWAGASQRGSYVQAMFFDGQGFMAHKSLGISGALELKDATVCVIQGTTIELNLQDFSGLNNLNIMPISFEDIAAAVAAYQNGQCDAFTHVRSQLAGIRSTFGNRDDHVILPDVIVEDPLGPVVPHGADQWFAIVRTVMSILIYAEAYGIDSTHVPTTVTGNLEVDRLFGPSRFVRPGEPGAQSDDGSGRDPGRGQLRRDLRPSHGSSG